jgi:hypothetical protein
MDAPGRVVTGTCNGHRFALGSSDAVEVPPERSLSCCARITRDGMTGWCLLQDGHGGDHLGVMSTIPAPDGSGPRSKSL